MTFASKLPPAPAAHAISVEGWWDALLSAASMAVMVTLIVGAYKLLPASWGSSGAARELDRYVGVKALRLRVVHAVELDAERSLVRAIAPDPYIVFERPPAVPSVQFIRLTMRPLRELPMDSFYVYFVPARVRSRSFSEENRVQGIVSARAEGWDVDWKLPEPAVLWRIDIPENAEFQLDRIALYGELPWWKLTSAGSSGPVLGLGAAIALTLIGLQLAWRRFVPSPMTVKAVLVGSLIAAFGMMVFILPPFQGPDEDAHWKLSLMFYRSEIAREPSAYYLPETLDTGRIKFNQEVKFNAQNLRGPVGSAGFAPQGMAASHQYLLRQYPYVRLLAYPLMFALSLLFPAINSVHEALQLFYLSRIVPGVLILALLYALNRTYELPYTTWFFFSLPLVIQQFVVVSADTLLNLGAVVAVFLFLKLRQRSSWPLIASLCVLCLAMIYSKFIVAGVLLLPLLLIPFRRIPRTSLLIGLALVLTVPVLYVLGGVVLDAVRDVGQALHRIGEVERQVAFLGTLEGLRTFAGALLRYCVRGFSFEAWSAPLGWLDTPLSPQHLSLIAASGLLAVFLDLWAYGPQIVSLVRTRAQELAVLAAVAIGTVIFAVVANAVLYYLMTTPVGADFIAGMQVRHLFPPAILAALLPLAVLTPRVSKAEGSPARSRIVADTLAMVLLPLLLLARTVELAIDLFTRYW